MYEKSEVSTYESKIEACIPDLVHGTPEDQWEDAIYDYSMDWLTWNVPSMPHEEKVKIAKRLSKTSV